MQGLAQSADFIALENAKLKREQSTGLVARVVGRFMVRTMRDKLVAAQAAERAMRSNQAEVHARVVQAEQKCNAMEREMMISRRRQAERDAAYEQQKADASELSVENRMLLDRTEQMLVDGQRYVAKLEMAEARSNTTTACKCSPRRPLLPTGTSPSSRWRRRAVLSLPPSSSLCENVPSSIGRFGRSDQRILPPSHVSIMRSPSPSSPCCRASSRARRRARGARPIVPTRPLRGAVVSTSMRLLPLRGRASRPVRRRAAAGGGPEVTGELRASRTCKCSPRRACGPVRERQRHNPDPRGVSMAVSSRR